MKKITKLFINISIFSCLFLTGCFNPVFYEIRKDVKPEPKTIYGPVNQLTRVTANDNTEYLVLAANKGVRYKKAESTGHDSWVSINNLPFDLVHYSNSSKSIEGEYIAGVYSSEDTLYMLSIVYDIDEDIGRTYPKKCTLWGTQDISTKGWNEKVNWTAIVSGEDYFPIYYQDTGFFSAFSIFQTNSIEKANRHVYLRKGNHGALNSKYETVTYYELSGTSTPAEITIPLDKIVDITKEEDSCIYSAIYFNGDVLFFNSPAATTNETNTTAADKFYYSVDNKIYYGTTKENVASTLTASNKISTLAVCSDVLLIGCADYNTTSVNGTKGGIYKTTLEAGIPGKALVDFSTNAKFQIPSSYYVTVLLNATPENSELESCLYCGTQIYGTDTSSTASFDNVGLWSYYPGRGNWNRE